MLCARRDRTTRSPEPLEQLLLDSAAQSELGSLSEQMAKPAAGVPPHLSSARYTGQSSALPAKNTKV
jgi:hypothetical protein